MSWQLVHVRLTRQHFFKDLLLRNYNTWEANFWNVPWVGLFKICSNGSEIPNIFRTGSEKPRKLANYLKIFFSRTDSATGEQKPVL
jgi:hypothetical protein